MSVRADTRLGAYAVVLDGRRSVLLTLWNGGRTPAWTLPGGGVELHEAPTDGLLREIREESGYDAQADRLLGVDVRVVPPEDRRSRRVPLRLVRLVYEAQVTGGTLAHEIAGTTDEARWFPLTSVAALPRTDLVDIGLDLAGIRSAP